MWGTYIRWILAAAILIAVVVLLEMLTGTGFLSGALRVAWNAIIYSGIFVVRFLESSAVQLVWRRILKIGAALGAIQTGYAMHVVFNRASLSRLKDSGAWWRRRTARMAAWWQRLSSLEKFLIAAELIALQVIFLPKAAEWIVLFPIGFMIPAFRRVGVMVADSTLVRVYMRIFGRPHRALMRLLGNIPAVRMLIGVVRLARFRYLTAWRLWKYDPKYRTEHGELWISFVEPFRLWRSGYLAEHYRKCRLLAGSSCSPSTKAAL